MKRTLRTVLLLAALTGLLVLAGCGGDEAEAEENATPAGLVPHARRPSGAAGHGRLRRSLGTNKTRPTERRLSPAVHR